MSKNVQMEVNGDTLVVTVDLTKNFGESKSGKTNIVAQASGKVPDTDDVGISLTVYKKKV